ncbi:MAG TPA: class E sortase, partial [Acidimicrobiales bacterium]|nr:class E sortase [Acidimicrobiales bacterium]
MVPPPAPTPSRAAAPGAPRAGAASDAVDSGAPGRPRGWQRLQRREQLATAFGWVRNVGAIVILFAGWQVWGTSISQRQAQQSLGSDFRAAAGHHTAASGTEPLIAAGSRIAQPQDGSVVARLQIPALGVDQYVVQGTAEGDLAKGPGHYQGTAMPGQGGNVAIAGHRTTYGAPFNNLDQLALGDPVVLTADSGRRFEYVVSQRPQAVAPSDVSVLRFFGDNRLTLTTCNPRFSASQRLVVVATLRTPVAQAPGAVGHERASTRPGGGGSVGWNLVYLPAALAVLAVMVLLGV